MPVVCDLAGLHVALWLSEVPSLLILEDSLSGQHSQLASKNLEIPHLGL